MPGGFGTLDEFFELLTLVQTGKIRKKMPIVLFGSQYWSEVINLEALERYGTINAQDLELFFRTDSVDEAFDFITEQLKSRSEEHTSELQSLRRISYDVFCLKKKKTH